MSAGTATISAGSTSTNLAIAVTNDTIVESQEELRLNSQILRMQYSVDLL